MRIRNILIFTAIAVLASGCGSSGGTSQPPAPPAPVTPPPPPPEPTFEERLSDLAEFDPNFCRAETPGFEALGGWLKNDGRALGTSRVWIRDQGSRTAPLSESHGARVWASFTACAARSDPERYFTDWPTLIEAQTNDGGDAIESYSLAPPWQDIPFPEPSILPDIFDGEREGQRILRIQGLGNENGRRTAFLQGRSFQAALLETDKALRILVGGYSGTGDDRKPAADVPVNPGTGAGGSNLSGSSLCSDAAPLCLFAPWEVKGRTDSASKIGTSHATPQVSAALDTVWAVWPDMDILDLRNLAFDCAEDMLAPEGETAVTRSYSYKNGRTFTSDTNSTWGHGILSLTCLFTPNGGLQNPVTGNPISGGIYGPLAGVVTGASISGVDYTGRDFGYGFAYPVARENWALASLTRAATAKLRPVQAIPGAYGLTHTRGAYSGRLWQRGAVSVDLTAAAPRGGAGNAIGAAVQWQSGGLTISSGLAVQPEGVGSLTGSRAFRAPTAISAAVTAAYGRVLARGYSAHLQADHWRTLATQGRSLWEAANLRETRLSAALVKRVGRNEFSLQGVWRSGLSGSLDVSGRNWAMSPQAESGVWVAWRSVL